MFEHAHENMTRAVKTGNQESANWRAAEKEFFRCVEEVNVLIRNLNLKDPLARFQGQIIDPQDELEKILIKPHID